MPKGVEHQAILAQLRQAGDVFYPLMPKGVEHKNVFRARLSFMPVFYPLMPKGVEHCSPTAINNFLAAGVLSVDAERR